MWTCITLHRLCKEILEDLPVTYELNAEGTEWVGRMMSYTVAGGKMNRGLATLSVRKTFAKLVGHSLNNKVHSHKYKYMRIYMLLYFQLRLHLYVYLFIYF